MPNLMDVETSLIAAMEELESVPEGAPFPEATEALVVGYLDAAAAKRDSMARFLDALEARSEAVDAEAKRLMEKSDQIARARARLADYVVLVMQRTGTKKLEGDTRTLAIQQNPSSVEVSGDVPAEYLLPQKPAPEPGPDKKRIKAALEAGEQVPNARIVQGKWRLVVK